MAKKKNGCLITTGIIIFIFIVMGWLGNTEFFRWYQATIDNEVTDYQEYIKKFPQGPNSAEARTRLQSLMNENTGDSLAWNNAENENNIASYESYLKSFPDGVNSTAAKIQIMKLKNPDAAKIFVVLIEHQKIDSKKAYDLFLKVPEEILAVYSPRFLGAYNDSYIEAAKTVAKFESKYEDILKAEWISGGGGRLCDKNGCWNPYKYYYYRTPSSYKEYRCEDHRKLGH